MELSFKALRIPAQLCTVRKKHVKEPSCFLITRCALGYGSDSFTLFCVPFVFVSTSSIKLFQYVSKLYPSLWYVNINQVSIQIFK